jgi:hypothetical protein
VIVSFDDVLAEHFRLPFLRPALKLAPTALASCRSWKIRRRIQAVSARLLHFGFSEWNLLVGQFHKGRDIAPLWGVFRCQIASSSLYFIGPEDGVLMALEGIFITGEHQSALARFRPL